MAEPQSAGASEGAKGAKPRSAPPMMMMIVALCSVASLGVSTMAMLSSRAPARQAAPKHSEAKKAEEGGEKARRDLGEFIVNLSDPDPQAFVKAGIVLEYEAGEKKGGGHGAKEEAPEWEPPVRDAVVSILSQCRRADLRTEKGKEELKKRILTRINKSGDSTLPRFVAVYLTSFAMQ